MARAASTGRRLGAAENHVGNVVSALEAYEKATEVAPDDVQGWVNWSAILYEQGHFAEAADLVRHAVDLHPHEAHFHYMLCAYLLADGRMREAYQPWKRPSRSTTTSTCCCSTTSPSCASSRA